jgi:hypothetical protein
MGAWTPFCSVLASVLLWSASAQVSSEPVSPFENETAKWSVLTYTQEYTDDQSQKVVYHGTLFIQLSKALLSECNLELLVHVQDRFTGTIFKPKLLSVKRTEIGQTSQTFNYRYQIALNKIQQLSTTVLDGRPAQIRPRTKYLCEEEPACKVNWLNVKLPETLIRETREKDGVVDFDRTVKEMTIPMSSRQAAQITATKLQELVTACRPNSRQ